MDYTPPPQDVIVDLRPGSEVRGPLVICDSNGNAVLTLDASGFVVIEAREKLP